MSTAIITISEAVFTALFKLWVLRFLGSLHLCLFYSYVNQTTKSNLSKNYYQIRSTGFPIQKTNFLLIIILIYFQKTWPHIKLFQYFKKLVSSTKSTINNHTTLTIYHWQISLSKSMLISVFNYSISYDKFIYHSVLA